MKKTWDDADLTLAVKECFSMTEVMERLNLKTTSNRTRDRLSARAKELELDRSHWRHGGGRGPGSRPWKTNDEIFSDGVPYSNVTRKRFLALVDYNCSMCGIAEWQGKPIVLQVDHIDGRKMNNRLNNLRLLCPNCHSQTETWGRKKPT